MASIKLKHTSGNGTILNSPAANPSSDITLKLPSTTGSAGQVLQVASANHSSTNAELEFAAVSVPSGDFVKLQSATATSTVATLDFQSLDVTTYKSFKFVFSLKPEVDGGQVFLRLFDGSTLKSSASTYNFARLDVKQEGGTYDTAAQTDYAKLIDSCGNNDIEGSRGELTFVPRVSGDPTHFNNFGFCHYNRYSTAAVHRGGSSYFRYVNSEVTDGFRIYFHSGNILAYSYVLYGLTR